jgi:hypothetical protein
VRSLVRQSIDRNGERVNLLDKIGVACGVGVMLCGVALLVLAGYVCTARGDFDFMDDPPENPDNWSHYPWIFW